MAAESDWIRVDIGEGSSLSPALRAKCSQPLPAQHVSMAALSTSEAKTAFHLVRHALGIEAIKEAARVDLQRLQLLSQWLASAEAYPSWH